ncbi:MAG: asparaginase [Propionibacteriaceae bacterium]
MPQSSLPHLVVIGTGGTIAGSHAAAGGKQSYTSAVETVESLIARLPGIAERARVSAEQLYQLDSSDIGFSAMCRLAMRIQELLDRDDVDAVVVTHGTDTLEESAFLVNLVVDSDKPIVFLGSMRPADALSADGPDNLYDALLVASSDNAKGQGVLVVFDDMILAARDACKSHTTRTDAFRSQHGELGDVVDNEVRFFRTVARRHTSGSAFARVALDQLPRVESVTTHPEFPLAILDAYVAADTRGLIHVGTGNGNIAHAMISTLDALVTHGIPVVRATRVHAGIVTRNGAVPDDDHGFIAADDHSPAHARILLSLALALTDDVEQIQRWFWTH